MRLRMPPTLLFGAGKLSELPGVLRELGVARPLLATDPGVAATGLPAGLGERLAEAGLDAEIWDGARPDPDVSHAESCRDRLVEDGRDSVVALGGGSVIDAAKVGAVLATNGGRASDYFDFDKVKRAGLPLVAAPTTAGGGGEVSSHAVLFRRDRSKKEVVAGLHLLPSAAVIDPEATLTLPPAETLYSALDGLVHAIEAFVARRATTLTDAFAREALPRIASALPRVAKDPADLAARSDLAEGCLCASLAMANANAGVIHALGYPLAGRYGTVHGLANGLMAAAALEHTWRARPERYAEVARRIAAGMGEAEALRHAGDTEAAARLPDLVRRLLADSGLTAKLADSGVRESDLDALAEDATRFRPVLENTPADLSGDDLLRIYRTAWAEVPAAPSGASR